MTQARPTAEELLDAVRTFLHDEVLPGLEGRVRFHTRVAVNVLDTVGRELHDGPTASRAERSRLLTLLHSSDPAAIEELGESDVDTLSRQLAAQIRDGAVTIDDPDLLAHLVETARADVAIANPKHLDEPAVGDQ